MQSSTDRVWLGTSLILGSALAYSTHGYFTRLIELDVWTLLFWRGLFGGLFIGAIVLWQNGRNTLAAVRSMGKAGIAVTCLSALSTICFISALRHTSVAEVMTIHAAIPFFTAAMAWIFTKDREDWLTILACVMALAGVAIIFGPNAEAGHLLGNGLAVVMAITMAALMVIIRRKRSTSMLPAAGLSAVLCSLAVFPFASPMAVPTTDMLLLFLFGTAQFGLGLLLLTLGTRLISATRSALIGSIENPLAPLWVWLAFNEIPTFAAIMGGTVVMAAVVLDVTAKWLKSSRPSQEHNTMQANL